MNDSYDSFLSNKPEPIPTRRRLWK